AFCRTSIVLEERRNVVGRGPIVVAVAVSPRAILAIPAAVSPGATVAIASAAARTTTIAVASAPAAFAITSGLTRRTGVFELLAGFLIDDAHRQANLAPVVDLEDLDLHFLAFGDDVGRLLDPLVLHLGDVDEAVLAAHEVHERAEVDDVDDLAAVDLADLGLLDDAEDPLLRRLDLVEIGRGDLDHALVVDVDLGSGLGNDLADHLAAGADHVADLRLVDLDRLDARRVGGKLGARRSQGLGHLAEDMRAAGLCLLERLGHDLLGDPGDLDVHLERGDPLLGAGHLEVHVAEVILVTEDVREDGKVLALEDQAHRDARDRARDRHAGIHHRQAPAAHRRHRARAVGFGDVAENTDRVGELFLRRQHRVQRAPGELAVADLTPTRGAEAAHFADRVGREVVV